MTFGQTSGRVLNEVGRLGSELALAGPTLLVAPAEAEVGEEVGGLIVEAPADADADFEVAGEEVVDAGAEVVLGAVALATLSKDAKVFRMGGPAVAEGDFEDGGRSPDVEVVAFGAVVAVADRGVPFPGLG